MDGDTGADEDLPDEVEALLDEALARHAEGKDQAAYRLWEQAFEQAEALGTDRGDEIATEIAARLASEAPTEQDALSWRTKAKALGTEAGTPRSLRIAADALWTQADLHAQDGKAQKATAAYQEAIDLGVQAGGDHGLATAAWVCLDLARLARATGDDQQAIAAAEQGLALAGDHEAGFPDLESMLLVLLGHASAAVGEDQEAVAAWRQAIEQGRPPLEEGAEVCRREAARASLALGSHHEAQEDLATARPAYEEALELGDFEHAEVPWHVGHRAALEAALRLAGSDLAEERSQEARIHLDRAHALLERATEALTDEQLEGLVGSLAAEAQVSETLAHGWRALRQGPGP